VTVFPVPVAPAIRPCLLAMDGMSEQLFPAASLPIVIAFAVASIEPPLFRAIVTNGPVKQNGEAGSARLPDSRRLLRGAARFDSGSADETGVRRMPETLFAPASFCALFVRRVKAHAQTSRPKRNRPRRADGARLRGIARASPRRQSRGLGRVAGAPPSAVSCRASG